MSRLVTEFKLNENILKHYFISVTVVFSSISIKLKINGDKT